MFPFFLLYFLGKGDSLVEKNKTPPSQRETSKEQGNNNIKGHDRLRRRAHHMRNDLVKNRKAKYNDEYSQNSSYNNNKYVG